MVWQLAFFGAVGVLATLTHVTIAWLAYASMGSHYLIANLLGASAAFFISFLGNARVTFRTSQPLPYAGLRYVVLTLASYALASGIMALVDSYDLPGYIYAVLVLCVVPPTTFVLARLWVFAADRP